MENQELWLVNYCHRDCEPLKNILWLPREEAFLKAAELAAAHPETTAFYRFADFVNYYPRRMETDRLLRERFIQMGGKPNTEHPLSFVLEGSDYLHNWFDRGIVTRIPLSALPEDKVSCTYGDSMSVLQREGDFVMLTVDMLTEAVQNDPAGIQGFMEKLKQKYQYVEVQVWQQLPVDGW